MLRSPCLYFVMESDEGGIGDGFVCHVGDKAVNLRLGLDNDRKPK